ncbi:hypothetical protein [Butyrivibrio hungatei]|uniref:Uncharacterized protein n=1 Tax=Butyrivibrio hungatei TaxID=185008 RepID=A0A1D9P6S2_9FIRM|nr:hypothetical protein [Butyrivibrio hungatei]AOZ97845.1 hypothetical protein bhn_II046 [Butyrivibrio hungatei]
MANDSRGFETPEAYKYVEEKAKNKAKQIAKAPLNKIKSVIREKTRKIRLIILVVVSVIIIIVIFPVLLLQGLWDVADAVKKTVSHEWATFWNRPEFDNDALNAWDSGGDPDATRQLLESMKATYEKKNGTSDGASSDSSRLDEESQAALDELMRTEHLFLAPEDMIDIMQYCADYNEAMFEWNDIYYESHQWELTRNVSETGAFLNWTWEESNPCKDVIPDLTDESANDGIYGNMTEENFKGEEIDGERVYSVHWQELMALAYMISEEQYGAKTLEGEINDESTYVASEGGNYGINSTDGYYLSTADLNYVYSVFGYNFIHRYNAVKDKNHQHSWTAIKYDTISTDPKVAYRYTRVADPTDWGPFYSDPHGYDGETVTPTVFAPDIAPKGAANMIETITYQYVSTSEVPDYTPDPENYTPPEGDYLVGKWRVINPDTFINTLSSDDYCPYYKEENNESSQKDYNWADRMMERYVFYLDFLYEGSGYGNSRSDYFTHLAELYNNNQIEVYYYGMKPSDEVVLEFIDTLQEQYPGKEIVINYDNAVDYGQFYDVTTDDVKSQARAGTIPFSSYGVTVPKGVGSGNSSANPSDVESGRVDVEANFVGDVYIAEATNPRTGVHYVVNGFVSLVDGADTPLDGGYYYTRDEIAAMVFKVAHLKENSFNWDAVVDDLTEYQHATQVDVAALLAIVMTEYSRGIGVPSYNWYNLTTKGNYYYLHPDTGQMKWWSPKKEYQNSYSTMATKYGTTGYKTLEGCCMVECMDSIVSRYWNKGQNTFYRMTFNTYGYPQDYDSSMAAMDNITHSYCPWWDDNGFTSTGKSENMWCNRNAINRMILLKVAGLS